VNEEALYYQRSQISDRLAYLMLHVPDFPAEDRTSLVQEREAMFSRIERYEREFPSAAKHPRFSLFRIEIGAAFDGAAAGASGATRLFQIAAERFDDTSCAPPNGPDFIVSGSGVTKA
jgi:hypothetical protein